MKRLLTIASASLLLFACNSEGEKSKETAGDTTAVEKNTAPTTYAPVDSATMMKNWLEYSTPGEIHKMIASWNGNWDGEVSMWHDPASPPQVSKSTSVNKMVMGGRYQVTNHTGTMMDMPFEGMAILAYDNARKEFISTWIDNVGTGVMTLKGTWDDATKSINLKGTCVDPSAGDGREMAVREVMKATDDNHQVMEMYGQGPDGKEFKMMEIKYTRKK